MTRSVSSDDALPRLAQGTRVVCCRSSYHSELTGLMRDSALETLLEAGLAEANVFEVVVPGAYELPIVARRLAQRADIDAVLCFGLILKGETEHDRHISNAVANGLTTVALETGQPVLFGVLTCNPLDQAQTSARRRACGGRSNRPGATELSPCPGGDLSRPRPRASRSRSAPSPAAVHAARPMAALSPTTRGETASRPSIPAQRTAPRPSSRR